MKNFTSFTKFMEYVTETNPNSKPVYSGYEAIKRIGQLVPEGNYRDATANHRHSYRSFRRFDIKIGKSTLRYYTSDSSLAYLSVTMSLSTYNEQPYPCNDESLEHLAKHLRAYANKKNSKLTKTTKKEVWSDLAFIGKMKTLAKKYSQDLVIQQHHYNKKNISITNETNSFYYTIKMTAKNKKWIQDEEIQKKLFEWLAPLAAYTARDSSLYPPSSCGFFVAQFKRN